MSQLHFNQHRLIRSSLGRFELFLDLLMVAIFANFASGLAEHPTGAQLAKYIVSRKEQNPLQS